ncbi:hypothetical protein [Aureimonas jatrophae]|uniref:Uncharacterized protein n=1 Tax=Aureimonas jatrophae TaxID=1166073 RepID=A0A1H0DDR6_9HYPH|nr:hypothetical protein [Aureimonas jatrophae]MBB3951829.1 hypothetical protein [Aureimonas jatrophae]SDN68146.1 hypothetical protein SAMN05192530_101722 [Aureimonas jatrophae]
MDRPSEQTILVWGHRTERPSATVWNIGPSHAEQTAAVWPSLRHAINYAIGMQPDREAMGLHPWIRTPQGHVYSPATVALMATVMFEADNPEHRRAAA